MQGTLDPVEQLLEVRSVEGFCWAIDTADRIGLQARDGEETLTGVGNLVSGMEGPGIAQEAENSGPETGVVPGWLAAQEGLEPEAPV